MSKVTVRGRDYGGEKVRLPIFDVIGVPNEGASPRGSTYYKTFQNCPYEFYLGYICGLRAEKESEPLTIGLLWHYMLEVYYKAIQAHQLATRANTRDPNWLYGGSAAGADTVYQIIEKVRATHGYIEVADIVNSMFDAYLERYDRRWPVRVIAVEETLRYTDDRMDFSTRLDLVVEDFDRGGMWIDEHKSAASLTDNLIGSYNLDLQVLGETFTLMNCVDLSQYPAFRGVIIDITTKAAPTSKQGPKLYQHPVVVSEHHLKNFVTTIQTRPRMLQVAAELNWPRFYGHCSGYSRGYSKCQFHDLCHDWPGVEVTPDSEPPPGYVRRTDETYLSENDA